ncbi:Uracil-DNA glycosylase [Rhizobiales bacterium GAS113]|nr:Uracil-DNA glycosylase [Rhizobiales bacterium GAS113]
MARYRAEQGRIHQLNQAPESLASLLREARACRICEANLPLGPRPVLHLANTARLLIIGQAPGSKVHQSGIPWNDVSGDRLRDWLKLDRSVFYDEARVAILPMGFCYPGVAASGGDNPPRPECAPSWHKRLLGHLPDLRLTLLIGQYSQRYYLGSRRKGSLTDTVEAFAEYGPKYFPLPHPSWRSVPWMRRHPWFELAVIPQLRKAVRNVI